MYTRLNRLGVCLSHKAVTRIVKQMGVGHDKPLRVWQTSLSKCEDKSTCAYFIVGDYIDKRITPRTMRLENQVKSIHYFNAYAACSVLRSNYVVLTARILVQHLPFLEQFKKCVPRHIEHPYSDAMKKKSKIVSILCNHT